MKTSLFTAIALLACLSGSAKKVKFSVDMTGQAVSSNSVHVTGDFQAAAGFAGGDWQPNTTVLTQEGTSNIYSIVVSIPAFRAYEYRFLNGDQSYDTEFVPEESRVGYNFDDNRWLYVDSLANDTTNIGAIVFSTNAPAGLSLLRFHVDMQGLISNAAGTHVAGSFQSFSTTKTRMYSFANSVYDHISYVSNGTYQFKYLNGNTAAAYETIPSACATAGNRTVTVAGDMVLDTVCFSSCSKCSLVNGIYEYSASSSIAVYPNPATDNCIIRMSDNSTLHDIRLTDMAGRIITTIKAYNGQACQINTAGLQSGMYMITVTDTESGAVHMSKLAVKQ